jgi:mannose-6-phosphate isomerase-like protein (cupin superfamily)
MSNTSENTPLHHEGIRKAYITIGCAQLAPMLAFFLERLHFRVDAIFPADAPHTALISGYGLNLYLIQGAQQDGPSTLRLLCDDPLAVAGGQTELVAPNGMAVRLVHADPPMTVPPTQQALVVTTLQENAHWGVGRAGLRYRDLLPDRHGGAFIASHIRLLQGGPVADYVHYHKVRFQLIFCRKGWVRVVYEGQGEPFLLEAGDCVLQPPLIRHRVLESSAGAEVIEIGAPAQHITMADPDMALPSAPLPPDHEFGGQRFVRSRLSEAVWAPWRLAGFEARDTGIAKATHGVASVRVVRNASAAPAAHHVQHSEFCFFYVLSGQMVVELDGARHELHADDSLTLPAGLPYRISATHPLEFLEVLLPAAD